jgi:hypothetical protein
MPAESRMVMRVYRFRRKGVDAVKIWIAAAGMMLLAGCSYLPSIPTPTFTDSNSLPDKQMTYKFDTSQAAAEPAPTEQKQPKAKKKAKRKSVAKKQQEAPAAAPEPEAPAE